jgi:hypothetical protein
MAVVRCRPTNVLGHSCHSARTPRPGPRNTPAPGSPTRRRRRAAAGRTSEAIGVHKSPLDSGPVGCRWHRHFSPEVHESADSVRSEKHPYPRVPQMPEMPLTLQGEREAGRAHGLPARRHSRARTAKQLVNWNADLIAHRFYRALRLATYYGQWLSLFSGKRGLKVGSNVQGGLSQARVYPQKVDICVSIPLRQLRAIVRNARRAKPCALRCDHVSCL